jgi:hypothetical protein
MALRLSNASTAYGKPLEQDRCYPSVPSSVGFSISRREEKGWKIDQAGEDIEQLSRLKTSLQLLILSNLIPTAPTRKYAMK